MDEKYDIDDSWKTLKLNINEEAAEALDERN